MSLALLVYLISTLKGVFVVALIGGILAVFLTLAFTLGRWDKENAEYRRMDKEEQTKYNDHMDKRAWQSLFAVGFAALVIVFVPNERDAYIITGAYMAQKIYESPETAKLQSKVLVILNKKLDTYIEEKATK